MSLVSVSVVVLLPLPPLPPLLLLLILPEGNAVPVPRCDILLHCHHSHLRLGRQRIHQPRSPCHPRPIPAANFRQRKRPAACQMSQIPVRMQAQCCEICHAGRVRGPRPGATGNLCFVVLIILFHPQLERGVKLQKQKLGFRGKKRLLTRGRRPLKKNVDGEWHRPITNPRLQHDTPSRE